MTLFIAQSTYTGSLAGTVETVPAFDQPRQIIDTKVRSMKLDQQSAGSLLPQGHTSLASIEATLAVTNRRPSLFDLDIPFQSVKFTTHNLHELVTSGHTLFSLPGKADARLTLIGHQSTQGMEHIQADINGNIATITRRGELFFATIALATGSYRMEGGTDHSRLYPHQQIAARTIQHNADFRYAN